MECPWHGAADRPEQVKIGESSSPTLCREAERTKASLAAKDGAPARLTDIALVGVWLANLPLLIAALMGLIALPYTVNKGTSTLSDIAGLFKKKE